MEKSNGALLPNKRRGPAGVLTSHPNDPFEIKAKRKGLSQACLSVTPDFMTDDRATELTQYTSHSSWNQKLKQAEVAFGKLRSLNASLHARTALDNRDRIHWSIRLSDSDN